MSNKSFVKRRVALSLAALMTLTSVNMTGFAKTVKNLEHLDDPVLGVDYVNVTMNPGTGNTVHWSNPVATPGNATPGNATPGDATSSNATPSDADGRSATFKFRVEGDFDGFKLNSKVIDNITDEYSLNFNNKAMDDAEIPYDQYENLVWLTKNGDLSTQITYEDIDLTADNTNIYAGWLFYADVNTTQLDPDSVKVMGLDGQVMAVDDLAERKTADQLTEELNKKEVGRYLNVDAENAIQVDMHAENASNVTVDMDLPDEFVERTRNKSVVVIHYGKNGVDVIDPETDRYYSGSRIDHISFKLPDLSPVIIATVDKMVDVTLENVKGGYGIVYNTYYDGGESGQLTYLPIGEKVKVPAGTELFMTAEAIGDASPNGFDITSNGETETLDFEYSYGHNMIIEDNTVITPKFIKYESDVTDDGQYLVKKISPSRHFDEPTATTHTFTFTDGKGNPVEIDDLRLSEDVNLHYHNDLFTLENGVLKSKDILDYGSYRIAVNYTDPFREKTVQWSFNITIGSLVEYDMYLGKLSDAGYDEWDIAGDYLGDSGMYPSKTTFKTMTDDAYAMYYGIPMANLKFGFYGNYTFSGWYEDAKTKLEDNTEITGLIGAYAMFKDAEGKLYNPQIHDLDYVTPGVNPNPSTPDDSDDGDSNYNHTYSSGGSAGKNYQTSGNTNSNWKLDAKGWWFRYNDGTWPSNKWEKLLWNGVESWYFFNAEGYMITGWFDYEGQRYFLHPISDGTMGYMYTGWKQIDGKMYYFNPVSDGTMGRLYVNTTTPDGYTVGADGARAN